MSRRIIGIAAVVGGLALFAYAVNRVGVDDIVDGVRRVGWGLLPVLALGGLRFVLRAESWRLCMPPGARLSHAQAFTAFLAGDAMGNITPLGLIASEPTKVFLTRHRLATAESISSLAVDNLVYITSVIVMVAIGGVAMVLTVPVSAASREATIGLVALIVVSMAVGIRLLMGTWSADRGQRPPWRHQLAALRERVLQFSAGHPARLLRAFSLDALFHALAVLEVFLTLRWLLGDRSPTLAQALVFAALDRVVTSAFKFVPFRAGVDEALTGAFAPLLLLQSTVGVTLAVVRKVRNLCWAGLGLALIAASRGQAARATDRHGNASAHPS